MGAPHMNHAFRSRKAREHMVTGEPSVGPLAPPWRRVVFASECDQDGTCPVCGIDYADCDCPGPTMDEEFDYREAGGVLWAKPRSVRTH